MLWTCTCGGGAKHSIERRSFIDLMKDYGPGVVIDAYSADLFKLGTVRVLAIEWKAKQILVEHYPPNGLNKIIPFSQLDGITGEYVKIT